MGLLARGDDQQSWSLCNRLIGEGGNIASRQIHRWGIVVSLYPWSLFILTMKVAASIHDFTKRVFPEPAWRQ